MKDPYGEQEVSRYNMPVASRQWLMDLLESHGQPLTLDALVELTGTPPELLDGLQARLFAMCRDGQIIQDRIDRFVLVNRAGLVAGVVHAHRDGYGFFVPDDGSESLYLHDRQMRRVYHGDRVLVAQKDDVASRQRRVHATPQSGKPDRCSAAEAEVCNDLAVALNVNTLDVVEHATATADDHQESTTAVVILLVHLEMLREVGDALGHERDLHLGGPSVGVVNPVVFDGLCLVGHKTAFLVSMMLTIVSASGRPLWRSQPARMRRSASRPRLSLNGRCNTTASRAEPQRAKSTPKGTARLRSPKCPAPFPSRMSPRPS